MRCWLACLLGMMLLPVPSLAAAASPDLSEQALPFDDIDPARAQEAVADRISAFITTLDQHWGQDQEVVREAAPGTVQREEPTALVYAGTLLDHGTVEGYEFLDGALVRGQYVLVQRPMNGLNEFIEFYLALKERLTRTFGAPDDDRTMWSNDLYQPLPDYWGIAVQLGHLRYAATWTTPGGVLTLDLTGQDHSRLMLDYRSIAFVDQARAI